MTVKWMLLYENSDGSWWITHGHTFWSKNYGLLFRFVLFLILILGTMFGIVIDFKRPDFYSLFPVEPQIALCTPLSLICTLLIHLCMHETKFGEKWEFLMVHKKRNEKSYIRLSCGINFIEPDFRFNKFIYVSWGHSIIIDMVAIERPNQFLYTTSLNHSNSNIYTFHI